MGKSDFKPQFTIDVNIAKALMRIEAVKEQVGALPLNLTVLASLRETARLRTTHYSTMIEGNSLNPQQVKDVITLNGHFPGRERDEQEVKSYYAALDFVDRYVIEKGIISEHLIQQLHAIVMGNGRTRVMPTPYRDGQNVIQDARTRSTVYMPPEAKDVPALMRSLVVWINEQKSSLPCPLVAAIAHYQFATIHPYYDGNGRTARLLTTMILHLGGYGLKGLYALEEYYAKGLQRYYDAISVGPSHNYYMGRANSDITEWTAYCITGMAIAFEKVIEQMSAALHRGGQDYVELLRTLDRKQRRVLELFKQYAVVTSSQIGALFGFQSRTSSALCKKWVDARFLKIIDPSLKARKYSLADEYEVLLRN